MMTGFTGNIRRKKEKRNPDESDDKLLNSFHNGPVPDTDTLMKINKTTFS